MPIVPLFDCAYVNRNLLGQNIIWCSENMKLKSEITEILLKTFFKTKTETYWSITTYIYNHGSLRYFD